MSLFPKSLPHLSGRIVLLSIKPKYAAQILSGIKRVEFRRAWAVQDVNVIVLYASSPIQKIVGVVKVDDTVTDSPTSLWKICTERGGGLTKQELRSYYTGKSQGVAVLLGEVFKFAEHIDPSDVISHFVPPQSFRYLNAVEYMELEKTVMSRKEKQ